MTLPAARSVCSVLISFVFIAYGVPSQGAECDNWQASHPSWLWCDSFETSTTLSARYEDVGSTGLSQSSEDAFDGNRSLRQSYEPGQVNAGWIIKVQDEGFPDHIFIRWYHKFGEGYTRLPPKMARTGYRIRSGSWESIFRVHIWTDETDHTLTADVLARNSSQTDSGWLPLKKSDFNFLEHLQEWVAVELEIQLNSPGEADGLYRVWVDDELKVEALGVDLRGGTQDKINEVMLDGYWNGGSTGDLVRYFDNFVIATSRIGLFEN
jgi:hypothetical protein